MPPGSGNIPTQRIKSNPEQDARVRKISELRQEEERIAKAKKDKIRKVLFWTVPPLLIAVSLLMYYAWLTNPKEFYAGLSSLGNGLLAFGALGAFFALVLQGEDSFYDGFGRYRG